MRARLLLVAVAVLLTAGCRAVIVPKPIRGWKRLGHVAAERSRLAWGAVRVSAKGPFSEVRLRLYNHDLQLDEVRLHYTTGKRETHELRTYMKRGAISPSLEVDEERTLKRVDLFMWSRGKGRGRALVRVYAKPVRAK